MAVLMDEYGPFNAGAGASVGETQWGRIYESLSSSGVSPKVLNELKVTQRGAGANMSVDVASGQVFLMGHQGRAASITNLGIGANATASTRYDRIIARADRTANTVVLDVLPGSAGVPAALTQNDVTWESHIALVTVAIGAASIVNANIAYKPVWATGRSGAPAALAFTVIGSGSGVDIPNGVQTILDLQTPYQDTLGYWSGAHPSRLTVPDQGIYLVGCQAFVDDSNVGANANIGKGITALTVLENGGSSLQSPQFTYWGAPPVAGATAPFNNPPTSHQFSASSIMQLGAGEYLEFSVFQTSGSTKKAFGLLYVARLGVA